MCADSLSLSSNLSVKQILAHALFLFRWDAAKAQMTTALLGMLGALTALALEASSDLTDFLQEHRK